MRHVLAAPLFASLLTLAAACGPSTCGQIGPIADAGVEPPPDAGPDEPPPPPERCDIPLDDWITPEGAGATITLLRSAAEGIGGPNAHAKAGDYLLQNDRIRVVIQGQDRNIGPNPYGGTILDADILRTGEGRDQFGELGLLYNFGRTVDARLFEVLADGKNGGSVVLAASGVDSDNDYLSIRNQLRNSLGDTLIADPYEPVPLKITQYFILSPGEARVRYVTAFCNTSDQEVRLAVGDLTDPGYTVEFFNGQSCTNGFGFGGLCFGLDRMSWYGYQGDDVAYGYAPWRPMAPIWPEPQNAVLTVSGITGAILGAPGIQGLAAWFNPTVPVREGELRIGPRQRRAILRDFVVGRDLGEVASIIYRTRAEATGAKTGRLSGRVMGADGPVAGARVSVRGPDQRYALFVTDGEGRYAGILPPGTYTVSAWAEGRVPSADTVVDVRPDQAAEADFTLGEERRLTVRVRDAASGAPLPAKVTVMCAGTCPAPSSALNIYTDTVRDPLPSNVQLVGFVPVEGEATFVLPPGFYSVVVTRGPEYSIFPNTWPNTPGASADLRTGDATLDATLARVLDTTGFMSADFHVHAVNSPDSAVENTRRVMSFIAEGVDVLVSTDHDYVTDFAPAVKALGAEDHIATVIGQEVSTMDYGHYNLFPIVRDAENLINGGAVDWAGGFGPTLTVGEIFEEGRRLGAKTIHFNHPRGFLGGLTHLKADMDTFATHADPREFRMAPPPGSGPEDTKLLSEDFDALEVLNSGEDEFEWAEMYPKFNDWFTLLSRGLRVTGTGVSDTHTQYAMSGGYWRTWVKLGIDAPADFSPTLMSTALNAQRAISSNGPFVDVRVVRVDPGGAETSLPAGLGDTLAASPDDVQVTLDIQVPEYLDVTKVELYMHTPADDARCPIDPESPVARTTRVACNGETNRNWPAQSITATSPVTLGPEDLEIVLDEGGVQYRRYRKQVRFTLPAPETDNWIVAFVYGSKPLFPLVFDKTSPGSAVKPVLPFALTNPVFVDADGGGYDKPPFNPSALRSHLTPGAGATPRTPARRRAPPTEAEVRDAFAPLSHAH